MLIGLVLIGQRVFEARDNRLLRMEMHLSAGAGGVPGGGVPGGGAGAFPTADAIVDFEKDTAWCRKTYGIPGQGDTVYSLSRHTISRLLDVMEKVNWQKFKTEFRKQGDGLPESTTTMIMSNDTIVVKDYGLVGDAPMHDLYETIYRLGPVKH